jgi:hypothetical protein
MTENLDVFGKVEALPNIPRKYYKLFWTASSLRYIVLPKLCIMDAEFKRGAKDHGE